MQNAAFRCGWIAGILFVVSIHSAFGENAGHHLIQNNQTEAQSEQSQAKNARAPHPATQSAEAPRRQDIIPKDQTGKPKEHKKPCENPANSEEDDTCSQFRSADAAKEQVDIGWKGLLASIVSAAATAVAAWAAAAAATAAKDAIRDAQSSRRAWLKLDLTPYREITYYETGGFYTQMTVSITNIGQSVARDVRVWPKAFTDEGVSTPHVWEESADWLFKRMAQRHPKERGRVILPNEMYSFEPDILIRPSEAVGSAKTRTGLIIRVALLAEYETDPVKGKRHTLTYFDVLGASDDRATWGVIQSEGPTPKDRLRANKSSGGKAT
ncbi:hypothetical protein [Methylocystis suflitae]|uniref:hypothetical protein n=1 Tax=Methylocystis suflitae TaxID=2951405 RepID=UPI00210C2BC9|nr:hypothetical protein [Methylocystis suflitae]MCQ4188994.1 hypothetical protein [Methylocystis suflitae]